MFLFKNTLNNDFNKQFYKDVSVNTLNIDFDNLFYKDMFLKFKHTGKKDLYNIFIVSLTIT
jgi:hypothetical protein